MDILFLVHRIPFPPNKGDKIRSYHELSHLAARHRVWLACFVDDAEDRRYAETVSNMCHRAVVIPLNRRLAAARGAWRMTRGATMTEGFYDHPAMRRRLSEWIRQRETSFDAVLAFSSGMANYGLHAPTRRRVLDFCDWDSLKWQALSDDATAPRKWAYGLESRRLARREAAWTRAYDASIVISAKEADATPFNECRDKIHVVGNGADETAEANTDSMLDPEAPPKIGFAGQMDYAPNVQAVRFFADEVFPHVRIAEPQATFEILGRRPTREVLALGNREQVTVVGEVTSMRDRMARLTVSVAPMRCGRGVQNKVLEAMAASRPVVLTSAAAAGVDGINGQDFVVADDAKRMADEIVDLLRNPDRRRRIGASARKSVLNRHSWQREMSKLEQLLLPSP